MDAQRDRSIGELVSDLSSQTSELIRQELKLARTEVSGKLAEAGWHLVQIGAAVACGLAAVLAVTAVIALLLIEADVAPWLAATIAAAVMGASAYALAQSGITGLRKQSLAPVETIHSLKETTVWIKNPSTL